MRWTLPALAAALLASLPAVAVQAGGTGTGAGAETAVPAKKVFRVTFRTVIPPAAEGSKRVEAWIPTPYQDDVQIVRSLEVTSPVETQRTFDKDTGNRYLHAAFDARPTETVVEWVAVIERTEDRGQSRGALLDAHLKSDTLAKVDGKARLLAESLGVVGAAVPTRDRAKAIYDHVLQSMAYDKVEPGWGKGDFERACDIGKGNCSDFTSKFVAISRAAGIPARWVSSISLAGEHKGCDACGYHCYAQFREGDRWIPVDPSDARRIVAKDPRKAAWYFGHAEAANIVLSMGRDLTLAPAQKAGPVNFLTGPYAEVDGKPIEIPAANRTYGHDTLNADGSPTAAEKPAEPKPSEPRLPAPSAPAAPTAPAAR